MCASKRKINASNRNTVNTGISTIINKILEFCNNTLKITGFMIRLGADNSKLIQLSNCNTKKNNNNPNTISNPKIFVKFLLRNMTITTTTILTTTKERRFDGRGVREGWGCWGWYLSWRQGQNAQAPPCSSSTEPEDCMLSVQSGFAIYWWLTVFACISVFYIWLVLLVEKLTSGKNRLWIKDFFNWHRHLIY